METTSSRHFLDCHSRCFLKGDCKISLAEKTIKREVRDERLCFILSIGLFPGKIRIRLARSGWRPILQVSECFPFLLVELCNNPHLVNFKPMPRVTSLAMTVGSTRATGVRDAGCVRMEEDRVGIRKVERVAVSQQFRPSLAYSVIYAFSNCRGELIVFYNGNVGLVSSITLYGRNGVVVSVLFSS